MSVGYSAMTVVGLVLSLAAAGIPSAQAQDAKAAYEQRVALMKRNGGNLKALSDVAKGEAQFSPQLADAAMGLVNNAKQIPSLFPPNSAIPESRAKPEIWTRWSEFEQFAKTMETEAGKLVTAASGNDPKALGTQVAAVGKVCADCHESFRSPPKK